MTVRISRKKKNMKPLIMKWWNCCGIVPALVHAYGAGTAFAQTAVALKRS